VKLSGFSSFYLYFSEANLSTLTSVASARVLWLLSLVKKRTSPRKQFALYFVADEQRPNHPEMN